MNNWQKPLKQKCEHCNKKLSKERILANLDISLKSHTQILNMCDSCWNSFCDHAITGE